MYDISELMIQFKSFVLIFLNFSYYNRDKYFEMFPKALEEMKDASILQKALFLPCFLENLNLNSNAFSKVFASEHYISFLYVCLRQSDAGYGEKADFYRALLIDHKVNKI